MAHIMKGKKSILSSGVSALDARLLHRGYQRGSLVLYYGVASSRKDLFAYNFLLEGLKAKETVVLYDVESSSDEIMNLFQTSETDLLKKLTFVDACPEYSKFYINAVPAKIIQHIKAIRRVKRVIINPLTFFVEKFGLADTGDFLIYLREIAMKRNLVIALVMADILSKKDMESIIDKCDAVIKLGLAEMTNKLYHYLQLRKQGGDQIKSKIPYVVLEKNLQIKTEDRIS